MEILPIIKRPLMAGCIALTITGVAHAGGEVSSVNVSETLATPFQYDLDSATYTWGMGKNQLLDGFTVGGRGYSYANSADRVELRRDDIAGLSSGNPCGIFAQRVGGSATLLSTDYPSDGSDTGNCDMAAMLASRVINRGALDVFSNKIPNPKNVERVDYLFDTGVSAPFTKNAMSRAGHVVAEKRGNNPIQIAAVLSLDVFGQPASYGPLVRVNEFFHACSGSEICYGVTTLRHNYLFFQSDSSGPQGFPRFLKESTESLAMAFISADELGLYEGQRYYGFSYFAKDVDTNVHTLSDPSSFPNDTADDYIVPGDGADIYGGVSGYFVGDDVSTGTGSLFKDENSDGQANDNEAGIASITLTLHEDSDNNGVYEQGVDEQVGDSLESDISGNFTLPGLSNQSYFLVLNENDADIPPGLVLPAGSNPTMFQVAGADVPNINFGFVSNTQNDSVDTTGGTTQGGDTTGGTTQGGDTTGGTTQGGDTTGGTTQGGNATGGTTTEGSPNDGVTSAVADTAIVNQGDSVLIDVLANDRDDSGLGLTLVSVSDSPNAGITITNDQISYIPNFGFFGMDSFLYVIRDGDGTQSTGTVNVDVIRFSDINGNNVNDFDECNCTSLILETGVNGSGLGKLPIDLLLMLGLVGLARLRSRRDHGAAL
ncbi:MAG: Ig-like domain-containing protein [Granulosicoccaceae bacterium]